MLCPELLIKKDLVSKVKKRALKCFTTVQILRQYILQSHLAYFGYFDKYRVAQKGVFQKLNRSALGQSIRFVDLVSTISEVTQKLQRLSETASRRLKQLNELNEGQIERMIDQKIQQFCQQVKYYKNYEISYYQNVQFYRKYILSLQNSIEEYDRQKSDPLTAYNIEITKMFKKEIEGKIKGLDSYEIKLNHDSQKLGFQKEQLTRKLLNFRKTTVDVGSMIYENFVELSKCITNHEKLSIQYQPSNTRGSLEPESPSKITLLYHRDSRQIRAEHLQYPETLTKQAESLLKQAENNLAMKKAIRDFLKKLTVQGKVLKDEMLTVREQVFSTYKVEKFQKNLRKYFGKKLFEYYEMFIMDHRLTYSLAEVLSNSLKSIAPDLQNVISLYTKCLKSLQSDLKNIQQQCAKSMDCYMTSRKDKAVKNQEFINSLVKCQNDYKSVVTEFRIRDEFNVNALCEKLKELRKMYESQFRREINLLERRKKNVVFEPELQMKQVMASDPKLSKILFHSFFQNPFLPNQYKQSKSFQPFLKQIYLAMSLAFNEQQNNKLCVGCISPEIKYLKSYKCALRDGISLLGKLHVNTRSVMFRSPFNSRNLFFGGTVIIIPKQDIIRIARNQTDFGPDGEITIVTVKGEIQFTSMYRRDKAYEFIRNQFKLVPITNLLAQAPAPAPPPTKDQSNAQDQKQVNFSMIASLLTKDQKLKDSVIEEQFSYEIRVGRLSQNPRACVKRLSQFHQLFMHDMIQDLQSTVNDSQQVYRYRLTIDNISYSIHETVDFQFEERDRSGQIISHIDCEITKGKLRQKFRDVLNIDYRFEGDRICYSFAKNFNRSFFTYYQNRFVKELKNFFYNYFSQFQNQIRLDNVILSPGKQAPDKGDLTSRSYTRQANSQSRLYKQRNKMLNVVLAGVLLVLLLALTKAYLS